MLNAVRMAANMVHPKTGTVAAVLRLPPNGPETTALRTFNSLANIVAYCIATQTGCEDLFDATRVPGGPCPTSVLQAVANIAKYPWLNVAKLFELSFNQPVYDPALARDQPPDAWTLFLKFTGSFSSIQDENNLLNGPGAFAIDRKGFLWVNDNYVPQPPDKLACAGMRLLKFYPWGENFPGSPYFGGGLWGRASASRSRRTIHLGRQFRLRGNRLPGTPGQQRFGVPARRKGALARRDRAHSRPDLLAAGNRARSPGEYLDRQLRRRFRHALPEGPAGQGVRDPHPAAGQCERGEDEDVRYRDRSPG